MPFWAFCQGAKTFIASVNPPTFPKSTLQTVDDRGSIIIQRVRIVARRISI